MVIVKIFKRFLWVLLLGLTLRVSAQNAEEERAKNIQSMFGLSVVHLTVIGVLDDDGLQREAVAKGSGLIASSNGHVLTVSHLFGKPGRYKRYEVEARLGSSTTNARDRPEVVKIDWDLDLALLKLPRAGNISNKWFRAPIGNPRLIADSAYVVALGFPAQLQTQQRAAGYVNDLNGPKGWMQINANVSQGYSGGPVFNEYGEVIGLVVAGFQNSALNYAIPIHYVAGMLALTGP